MGNILPKKEALKYFLEGTLDSSALSNILSGEIHEEHDTDDGSMPSKGISFKSFFCHSFYPVLSNSTC